jgi:hypothetical protein
MRQGDTPHLISPNAGLLQDQDEKRSLIALVVLGLPAASFHDPFHIGGPGTR